MSSIDDFKDILRENEPLAPFTWLKVGGSARYFAEPRNRDELVSLVRCANENGLETRILGGGSNLLVPDAGFDGLVVRINGEAFSEISIDGNRVTVGTGALLSELISQTVKAGLAGLECLVGIPGTVGGALHGNAGGRDGEIGQFVRSATVLTANGEVSSRGEDSLSFSYRKSSLNELVLLDATLELTPDDSEEVTERIRKNWILKKASQPLASQSAGCIFKNPRGLSAGSLIEQAGQKGTRVGGAEVSDRHANFIVTSDDAKAQDVLELIDIVRQQVDEQFGVELETEIRIW